VKKLSEIANIDKPREKLARRGVQALSSHELLMVLLGSGTQGRDVARLAADILKVIESEKENLKIDKLLKVQGIGKAKAGQILASFELAKRYLLKEEKKIKSTEDVLALVQDIRDKKQEHFLTITLTGASSLIEKREVFKGTVDYSLVHPREIFADALTDRAAGIIFVHNHPADDAEPSEADIKLTKNLCDAAKLMGIQVIDHIIVTKQNHFSFQNAGLINKL
jgi:DNA repair protein RadC